MKRIVNQVTKVNISPSTAEKFRNRKVAEFYVFLRQNWQSMKKYSLLLSLTVILFITGITFSSCKKKTDPVPDFPQLIGHWAGTTSQGAGIYFTVDNLQGNLNVTRYDLTVYTSGGYRQYKVINSNGIAYVTNKQFRIHLGTGTAGESFIEGTFNINDMSLYGSFAVYDQGNSTDIYTGTYSCSMGD
jgi:hypothetical protein